MFLQERIILGGETFCAAKQLQTKLRLTEPSTYVDDVPRARTGPQHGLSSSNLADNGQVDEDFVSPCRVSARERTLEFA
jgi:hypothetical protein